MAREYLNETGLASLWAKIVNKINALGDQLHAEWDASVQTLTMMIATKIDKTGDTATGKITFKAGIGIGSGNQLANPPYFLTLNEPFNDGGSVGYATTNTVADKIGAVKIAGSTMTGILSMKATNVDASKTNNNVSSTQYPTTYNILDNAGRIISRKECIVQSDGQIGSYWYTRNYNTSGGQVAQKGIRMMMNKSGALTWSVDDAASFRSAIGVYAPTYSSASGTYKTAAWGDGTNTCTWKAPAAGLYIVWMRFDLSDASAANRGAYVQLQMRGTATRLFNNTLYYDAEAASPRVVRTMCQPVSATAANQTIVPYIHTPTANVTYNVSVIAIRLT